MSVARHPMPGGGTATVLHRKISSENTLLVHFGFQTNSFMICGFCGAGCVLEEDQNFEDAAKWFNRHCDNLRKGRASIPPHPTEETITEKPLTEIITKTSNANNVRGFVGRRRGRLISGQLLRTILGETVVESMMCESGVIITHCCLKRGKCCMKRMPMTVQMYRSGLRMDPIYCTDDLALLQREYAMLEPPPPPTLPPPPPPSTPSSSSSLAQQSTNSEQQVASANLLADAIARSGAGTPGSARGSEKKLRLMIAPVQDRVTFAVDEVPKNKGAGLALFERGLMKIAQPDTKKSVVIRGKSQGVITNPVLYALDISNEEAEDMLRRGVELARNHEFCSQEGFHTIVMACAETIVETLLCLLQTLDPITKTLVSKLPHLCSSSDVEDKRGSDSRIVGLREFTPLGPTLRRRVDAMFKLLLTLYKNGNFAESPQVRAALEQVKTLLESVTDHDTNCSVSSTRTALINADIQKEVTELLFDIVTLLTTLGKSLSQDPLKEIVSSWAFGTSADLPVLPAEADGMDDEVSEDVPTTHGEQSLPQQGAQIRGASAIRSNLSNLLSNFKYLAAWEVVKHLEELHSLAYSFHVMEESGALDEQQTLDLEQSVARAILDQGGVDTILGAYKGTVLIPHLATLISRLHRVESTTGGLTNMWTETAATWDGPVFQLGEMQVTFSKYRGACAVVQRVVKEILIEIIAVAWDEESKGCILDQEFVKVLFERPSRGSYKIVTKGNNAFALPGLMLEGDVLVEKLSTAINESFAKDSAKCTILCRALDQNLLGLIALTSSCTIRSEDLYRLNRGLDQTSPGNVIRYMTADDDHTLMMLIEADKTLVIAANMMPPHVARILLVRLDLIGPQVGKHLVSLVLGEITLELNTSLAIQAQGLQSWICEAYRKFSMTRLDFDVTRLRRDFLKALNEVKSAPGMQLRNGYSTIAVMTPNSGSDAKEVSLHPETAVFFPNTDMMNGDLRNVICSTGFELPHMTIPQLRSVMVNLRHKIPVAIEKIKDIHAGQALIIERLNDHQRRDIEVNLLHGSLQKAHATGNHGPGTQLQHYHSGDMFPNPSGGEIRFPQLLSRSALVIEEGLSIIHLWPRPPPKDPSRHQTPNEGMRKSITEMAGFGSANPACDALLAKIKTSFNMSKPEFKSRLQERTMRKVVRDNDDLLILDVCGGGKTMSAVLPYCLVEGLGLIVVLICPFLSVLHSHEHALTERRISHVVCESENDTMFSPGALSAGFWKDDADTTVILVTSDRFVTERFRAFVHAGDRSLRIACIVVDEAHEVILATGYRTCMVRLPEVLRSVTTRVVFLSGTLPEELQSILLSRCGLGNGVRVIQDTSIKILERKRIVHAVFADKTDVNIAACKFLKTWLAKRKHEGKQVILVYSATRAASATVAAKLKDSTSASIFQVDSQTRKEERKVVMDAIFTGDQESVILCTTSGFGAGIDIKNCRLVLVVGGNHMGILEFIQMCGRVSREKMSDTSVRGDVVYLCAPTDFQRVTGATSIAAKDAENANVLGSSASPRAKSLIAYGPIVRIVAKCARLRLCVTRQMECFFSNRPQEELVDCGACNMCALRVTGSCHELFVGLDTSIPSDEEVDQLLRANEPIRSKPSSLNEAIRQTTENEKVKADAIGFLQSQEGQKCPACKGPIHMTKSCTEMKKLGGCFQCYQRDHSFGEMQKKLNANPDKDTKYKSVKGCAIIIDQCTLAKNADPCGICFLSHPGREEKCAVMDPLAHRARIIAVNVYRNTELRKRFCEAMVGQNLKQGVTWAEFFEWLVYGGIPGFNNTYRLLAWWSSHRE